MNYYKHHIGDFIRDTSRLTDSQCMAYLRMLWMYYETEEPFDCDIDALAFKIGANASEVHQILKHFFFEHEGKWHHSRCDKEILEFRGKSDKAKNSANARWSNANAMRTHTERNANEAKIDANHKPLTNNQEPIKPTAAPDGFAEFWSAYPRKVAKGNAEKAWNKHKPPLAACLAAIDKSKNSAEWQKDGGQFIPHPATWINGKRWEDGDAVKPVAGGFIDTRPEWMRAAI